MTIDRRPTEAEHDRGARASSIETGPLPGEPGARKNSDRDIRVRVGILTAPASPPTTFIAACALSIGDLRPSPRASLQTRRTCRSSMSIRTDEFSGRYNSDSETQRTDKLWAATRTMVQGRPFTLRISPTISHRLPPNLPLPRRGPEHDDGVGVAVSTFACSYQASEGRPGMSSSGKELRVTQATSTRWGRLPSDARPKNPQTCTRQCPRQRRPGGARGNPEVGERHSAERAVSMCSWLAITTIRSVFLTGSGPQDDAFTTLKTAASTPTPRAKVRATAAVKIGDFRKSSCRRHERQSATSCRQPSRSAS